MTTFTDGAPPSVAPDPDDSDDEGTSWLREEIQRRIAAGRSHSGGRHARRDVVGSPGSVGYVPRHSVATPGPGAPRPGPVSPQPSELLRRERTSAGRPAWSGPPGHTEEALGRPPLRVVGPDGDVQATAPSPALPRAPGAAAPTTEPASPAASVPAPAAPATAVPATDDAPDTDAAAASAPTAPDAPDVEAPAVEAPAAETPAEGTSVPVADRPTAPDADVPAASSPTASAPTTPSPRPRANAASVTAPHPVTPPTVDPPAPGSSAVPPPAVPPAPALPAAAASTEAPPADPAVTVPGPETQPSPLIDDLAGPDTAAPPQDGAQQPTPLRAAGAAFTGDPVFTARTPIRSLLSIPAQRGAGPSQGARPEADELDDLASKRVRVVLAERKGVARPVRTVVDIEEGTGVGELLRSNLIGSQLAVALRFAVVAGITLGVLPLLFAMVPEIGRIEVFGLRLPWLLLGLLVYPFLFGLGLWHTRTAERVEKNFADHVQD